MSLTAKRSFRVKLNSSIRFHRILLRKTGEKNRAMLIESATTGYPKAYTQEMNTFENLFPQESSLSKYRQLLSNNFSGNKLEWLHYISFGHDKYQHKTMNESQHVSICLNFQCLVKPLSFSFFFVSLRSTKNQLSLGKKSFPDFPPG